MNEGLLVSPIECALTSCIGENKLGAIDKKGFIEILDQLRELDEDKLNRVIESGSIIVNGKVDIGDETDVTYTVNSMWDITRYRCGVKHCCYLITPSNIKATNIFINVMKFFAWKHGLEDIDFDLWVRYKHASKIFYLEEFVAILNNPRLLEAMQVYNPLFNKQEYNDWVKQYGWCYPTMVFPYRKFLNAHIRYVNRRKEYIAKGNKG